MRISPSWTENGSSFGSSTRPKGARTSKVWRSESSDGSVICEIRPTMILSSTRSALRLVRPPRLIGLPPARATTFIRESSFRTGRMALLGQTFSHMPQPTQAFARPFFCRITGTAACRWVGSGWCPVEIVMERRSIRASIAPKVQAATQLPHIVQRSGV